MFYLLSPHSDPRPKQSPPRPLPPNVLGHSHVVPVLTEKTNWILRGNCVFLLLLFRLPGNLTLCFPSECHVGRPVTGGHVHECCGSPASSAGHSRALQSPTSLTQITDFWPAPPTKSVEILRCDWAAQWAHRRWELWSSGRDSCLPVSFLPFFP